MTPLVPMLTIRYDTIRELARELFPDEPDLQYICYDAFHSHDDEVFPKTCKKTEALQVIGVVGHTVLYIDKKQCLDQKQFKFGDHNLHPVEMYLCLRPFSRDPANSHLTRIYIRPAAETRFYKSLEVPALEKNDG
jgi:hypothetical protein